MNLRFSHMTSALLIAFASTTNVFAASGGDTPPALKLTQAMSGSLSEAMSCHASCSSGHMQCLADGLDYSLVSSPQEGAERFQSNLSVRQECASASAACHADCN